MNSVLKVRPAEERDIPDLTRFRLEAQDGINEALYEGLEQSVEDIICNEMKDPGSYESYRTYCVIETDEGVVAGMQSFPWDTFLSFDYNPLIPRDRYYLEEPFDEMPAKGTYYLHVLAVNAECLRQGLASRLLTHFHKLASSEGFETKSLYCLEENLGAVKLYEKHGYRTVDKRPMAKHEKIRHGGNILLMTSR
ncbi:MAG: GNAT family N-acetyltransferase [Pseudomonadota bacterium]